MSVKILSTIPIILILSACGGGDSGSGSDAVGSYRTLKVFSDGAGVGSGVAEDGSKVVFIAPEIAATIAEANSVTEQDIADIQVSDFPVVQTLQTNANLRQGALTIDGVTANVTAVEDLGGEAGLVLLEIPNVANAGMATGTALTGNPVGTQTYSGTMTMGARGVNSNQQFGGFTMGADFNSKSYTFNGNTSNHSLSGSGVIDTQSGSFSSNNLDAMTNGTNRTATMYGQLHGNEAKSVSGVFHTNESGADYVGGFVGSRP